MIIRTVFYFALTITVVAAVGLIILLSGAHAAESTLPPKQFDHEPRLPYSVRYVEQDVINMLCGYSLRMAGPGHRVVGCTVPRSRQVFIVKGLTKSNEERTLRHEKAHLNGWRH